MAFGLVHLLPRKVHLHGMATCLLAHVVAEESFGVPVAILELCLWPYVISDCLTLPNLLAANIVVVVTAKAADR